MNQGGHPADDSAAARELKDELRTVSASFRKKNSRHFLSTKNVIYCAFSTPGFSVDRAEAQRDAARRLEQFGLSPLEFRGKSVLDLGCNNGAMLFQISNYGPSRQLGIEYDPEKVDLARRIASFAGIRDIEFRVGDLDALEARDIGETFDVVLSLAIEAHVQRPERLYQLLAQVTRGVLLFEANASTKPKSVIAALTKGGFSDIRHLGTCDDDIVPRNNRRPIFLARHG